jgi:hypothetical protein
MGFYSRFIFPRLCDCLMGQPFLAGHRKDVLADVAKDPRDVVSWVGDEVRSRIW